MKIQNNQNNIAFRIKRPGYVYKILEDTRETNKQNVNKHSALLPISTTTSAIKDLKLEVEKTLKKLGITYCEVNNNILNATAGYNGGFYSIKNDYIVEPELLKIYFAQTLINNDTSAFGGLVNYKTMVNQLKRQDIIQKGLQVHTYKMNNKISPEQSYFAAVNISKLTSKYIKPKNLFFIDSEAFYYDELEKTVYSVNALAPTSEKMNKTFRTCKFVTDVNGNAIGYTTKGNDIFKLQETETVYKEQQEASCQLPEIAAPECNKLFAEAFRFGNANNIISAKIKYSTPLVLKHLYERVGINCPTSEQLQIVKFYDKDKNILKRICYYDSATGRSLVYNDDGKYLYQMEYQKDMFGNITACSKF